jgi:hypothetical protein
MHGDFLGSYAGVLLGTRCNSAAINAFREPEYPFLSG